LVDLFEDGVIDPLRVVRLTIQHAASVAALMLTTEAIVAEELIAQPGAVIAPGFGDLAEGLARPSSPVYANPPRGVDLLGNSRGRIRLRIASPIPMPPLLTPAVGFTII
jgi:hypothetical protein